MKKIQWDVFVEGFGGQVTSVIFFCITTSFPDGSLGATGFIELANWSCKTLATSLKQFFFCFIKLKSPAGLICLHAQNLKGGSKWTRDYRMDVYLRLLHKFFLEGVFSPLAESCTVVIGAKRL